jgi:flagellar biosynthesis/type III secretory pathway M-ring protein FliF/YscJ
MNNSIPSLRILPADMGAAPAGAPEAGKFLETLKQSMEQAQGAQSDAAVQVAQLLNEKLARAAIGVDDQRGDLLAVENLSFRAIPVESPIAPSRWEKWRLLLMPWLGVLRYLGITLLFLAVYALVLNPVKKQAIAAFKQIPEHLAQKPLVAATASKEDILSSIDLPRGSEVAQRAGVLKKELTEKIKAEPAAASRLVQTWMHDQKPSQST